MRGGADEGRLDPEAVDAMLAVAQRAGGSKESLYSWFGSKEGLLAAMIRREAEQASAAVEGALTGSPTRAGRSRASHGGR